MVSNSAEYMRNYCLTHPDYVRQHNEYSKKWHHEHPAEGRKWNNITYVRLKLKVLSHYCDGEPHCVRCGEIQLRKLCLDHINEDGREHRKIIQGGSKGIYLWAIKNNYPKVLQVLCYKCNNLKYRLSKISQESACEGAGKNPPKTET